MRRSRMPILNGVKRRPENRAGLVTLFAHLKAVLGGVSGSGEVKGSSLNRDLCNILLRHREVEFIGMSKRREVV